MWRKLLRGNELRYIHAMEKKTRVNMHCCPSPPMSFPAALDLANRARKGAN